MTYNAHHTYEVVDTDHTVLAEIEFQKGPIRDNGLNGVQNEDLIAMVIHRLQCFQQSPFECKENKEALNSLRAALESLESRSQRRMK